MLSQSDAATGWRAAPAFISDSLDRWWSRGGFAGQLRVSARVIYALLLREATTRYGRRSAGYVWALIQPIIQLGAMLGVFSVLGRAPGAGNSLVIFFITGIMPLLAVQNGLSRGAGAIPSNRTLMNYPQVRGFEVITARVLLDLLINLTVTLIVVAFMWAFQGIPLSEWIDHPLSLLGALGALSLLCYSVAFLSAQIGRMFDQWVEIMGALGRVLFFTSGIWFTLDTLPPAIRKYAAFNPVTQIIEWIRDAGLPSFESSHLNMMYPIKFGIICLVLGLFLEWFYRLTGLDLERKVG